MKRILILTVGGSCDPIINAIKLYNPDFIYFLASSGTKGSGIRINSSGDPCADKKIRCPDCGNDFYLGNPKGTSIITQTKLKENQYKIILIDDPDNLDGCYTKLKEIREEINELFPNSEVIANFTGGTKVMSASLAFFGVMNPEWKLSLNIAKRKNAVKVTSGDIPVIINKWQIFCDQKISEANRALKKYDYETAEHVFKEFLMQPLEPEYQKKLQEWIDVCKSFTCWDRFDHQEALTLLDAFGNHYAEYIIILKKLLKKDKKSQGYEMVSDLINNAERKATQGRYDDAVARLYRATELFAQVRLKTLLPQSEFGKFKLTDLPIELQPDYKNRVRENQQLVLGLCEVYTLLDNLDDTVGSTYKTMEKKILDALLKRNNSIYAHGITPLSENDYNTVKQSLYYLMNQAANAINVDLTQKQLPDYLKDVN